VNKKQISLYKKKKEKLNLKKKLILERLLNKIKNKEQTILSDEE
jgi:hypothetical protein